MSEHLTYFLVYFLLPFLDRRMKRAKLVASAMTNGLTIPIFLKQNQRRLRGMCGTLVDRCDDALLLLLALLLCLDYFLTVL